jgi:hypothetical protein
MKKCNQDCPCCGREANDIRPECDPRHYASGELVAWRLHWVCDRCGCRWLDGQRFDGNEGKDKEA